MVEIFNQYQSEIFGVIGLAIGLVVPQVVVKAKVVLALIKSKIGDKNYEACKQFVLNLAELHKEDFTEDKIADLLDKLDNKFGDHLSRNQIKEIVDFVVKTVIADVANQVVKSA